MPSGKNTTEAEKEQIKTLYTRGLSAPQIARELNLKRQTVHKWIARLIHGTVQMTRAGPSVSVIKRAEHIDYSQAKFTRHTMKPDPRWPVCNGLMTERFDPAKHLTAR